MAILLLRIQQFLPAHPCWSLWLLGLLLLHLFVRLLSRVWSRRLLGWLLLRLQLVLLRSRVWSRLRLLGWLLALLFLLSLIKLLCRYVYRWRALAIFAGRMLGWYLLCTPDLRLGVGAFRSSFVRSALRGA